MGRRLFATALALALVLFGAQAAQTAQADRPSPALGAAQAASLAGYWKFDEGTGTTAADSSGGGHPLTLQGGATWTTGVVGPHALSVTPQQDAASTVPVVDTSNSFTVSAWVNLSNTNGFQTFVAKEVTVDISSEPPTDSMLSA